MKIKIWAELDFDERVIDVYQYAGITDEMWEAMPEVDKHEIAYDWAVEQLRCGYEEM